jgi:hypothetical protein
MAVFGTEVWLARGELFTVVARTFARFAPVELFVQRPAGECRAHRCVEEERVNCPSCWLDADPEDRRMRLRTYGSGVRREPSLGTGGGTFVLALLATVVYDGFSQTQKYVDWQSWFVDRSTLARGPRDGARHASHGRRGRSFRARVPPRRLFVSRLEATSVSDAARAMRRH